MWTTVEISIATSLERDYVLGPNRKVRDASAQASDRATDVTPGSDRRRATGTAISAVPKLLSVPHVRQDPACSIAAQACRISRSFGRIRQLPQLLQCRARWPNPCRADAGALAGAAIACAADRRKAQFQAAPEQVIRHGLARIPARARTCWQSVSRKRSGHLASRAKARNWPKDGARDHLWS
jgi:hypothetical protein